MSQIYNRNDPQVCCGIVLILGNLYLVGGHASRVLTVKHSRRK